MVSNDGRLVEPNPNSLLHSLLSHDSAKTIKPVGNSLKQPLSGLYTTRERNLRERLLKMQFLAKKYKTRMNTLSKKVRRLQNQNKTLKSMLINQHRQTSNR